MPDTSTPRQDADYDSIFACEEIDDPWVLVMKLRMELRGRLDVPLHEEASWTRGYAAGYKAGHIQGTAGTSVPLWVKPDEAKDQVKIFE